MIAICKSLKEFKLAFAIFRAIPSLRSLFYMLLYCLLWLIIGILGFLVEIATALIGREYKKINYGPRAVTFDTVCLVIGTAIGLYFLIF